MVSALSSEKFMSRNSLTMYDFDPGGTSAVDVAWVDLRDYEGICVAVMDSVGTGGIAAFSILSNSASDGSGTDVTIKTSSTTTANAVGDTIVLEATAEEIAALDPDGRYVSASVTLTTGTDECVVSYVRYNSKRATTGLTADVIS